MQTTTSADARRAARLARQKAHAYMLPKKEQFYETEPYVAVPPALYITDAANNVWTLGYSYCALSNGPKGEYAFNVLRNRIDMGVFTSRIECNGKRVRILQRGGTWLYWNGKSFT
jgi:hypothetical protein